MEEDVQDSMWPLPKFYFSVRFDSMEDAVVFQEVTGLDVKTDTIGYRHNQFSSIKMPGIAKGSTVTLRKGIFQSDTHFYAWYNAISINTIKRETVTIQLLDENGHPSMTWNLLNAWPIKITGTDLKSEGNEIAVESMELAHEGLTIVNG
ncbi:phage tail protein [Cyclobacterium roseum]|uniref:phage tail protein n=1 Tax=Cyclobacterium roseum TaxID=2666137 RepID=UPI00139102E0|nr:phage tail protein [Cyclobacterium roseum]